MPWIEAVGIVIPNWESLAILGGIVVIRTVTAFLLNHDLPGK